MNRKFPRVTKVYSTTTTTANTNNINNNTISKSVKAEDGRMWRVTITNNVDEIGGTSLPSMMIRNEDANVEKNFFYN